MNVIGRFREIYNDNSLPSIKDNVSDVPAPNKKKILEHLNSGKVVAESPSLVTDVMSGKKTDVNLVIMTDGKYKWRSDITYYFENYNLSLPESFINDVLNTN